MRRLGVLLAVTLFAGTMMFGCGNGQEIESEAPEPPPEQQQEWEELQRELRPPD